MEEFVPPEFYKDVMVQVGYSFTYKQDERDASTNLKAVKWTSRREILGELGVSQRAISAVNLVYNCAQDPDALPLSIQERACAPFKTINTYFDTGSLSIGRTTSYGSGGGGRWPVNGAVRADAPPPPPR